MSDSTCVQCRTSLPHRLHIEVVNLNTVVFTDHAGKVVKQPSTKGHSCPLCYQQVSFIDPEFGNTFCLWCEWTGEVEAVL